ncbi:MAG: hypothetical protein J2P45_12760 [Candidatus Dormibacteraeota bacterium]|nr:hypothetical protein [Candidatus Dormibacteraeota bacterium]
MTEPVVGWRLWRLSGGHLSSWAVEHSWEPGENHATCLAPVGFPCTTPPGRHCQCGFWALWSPAACCERARGVGEPSSHVLGLIAGWGTVALHGREGFRAERASITCLFRDSPSSTPPSLPLARRLLKWWQSSWGRPLEPQGRADPTTDRRRDRELELAARRYGVPVVSLQGAADVGLLSEWGVSRPQIDEARRLTAKPPV